MGYSIPLFNSNFYLFGCNFSSFYCGIACKECYCVRSGFCKYVAVTIYTAVDIFDILSGIGSTGIQFDRVGNQPVVIICPCSMSIVSSLELELVLALVNQTPCSLDDTSGGYHLVAIVIFVRGVDIEARKVHRGTCHFSHASIGQSVSDDNVPEIYSTLRSCFRSSCKRKAMVNPAW